MIYKFHIFDYICRVCRTSALFLLCYSLALLCSLTHHLILK
nr:MAG TPA: hypothetical protein [Caudoviricetes sp.]